MEERHNGIVEVVSSNLIVSKNAKKSRRQACGIFLCPARYAEKTGLCCAENFGGMVADRFGAMELAGFWRFLSGEFVQSGGGLILRKGRNQSPAKEAGKICEIAKGF